MSDLSDLICGRIGQHLPAGSEFAEILLYIQETMDSVLEQLVWLGKQDETRVSLYGPFLGRSLLELATTALIGRLDPLRLLVVRQIQTQPSYDARAVWRASIRWQGDVLSAKRTNEQLWGEGLEYEKITKALLGDYYDHLLWRPAFSRMTAEPLGNGGVWLASLGGIDADSFVARKREEISRLYSALSKGIHHEFVMPPGALYDKSTVKNLVQETIHSIADLGLVSQYVTHLQFPMPVVDALTTFGRIEALEVIS